MESLEVFDVKTFVGAKNFEQSRDFYIALGWHLNFETDELAELELGNVRFYLQRYYDQAWCENSMLHITVASAQAWYEHAKSALESGPYGTARAQAPSEQPYGALVTFVWDPAGVLLHFAQFHGSDQE